LSLSLLPAQGVSEAPHTFFECERPSEPAPGDTQIAADHWRISLTQGGQGSDVGIQIGSIQLLAPFSALPTIWHRVCESSCLGFAEPSYTPWMGYLVAHEDPAFVTAKNKTADSAEFPWSDDWHRTPSRAYRPSHSLDDDGLPTVIHHATGHY